MSQNAGWNPQLQSGQVGVNPFSPQGTETEVIRASEEDNVRDLELRKRRRWTMLLWVISAVVAIVFVTIFMMFVWS